MWQQAGLVFQQVHLVDHQHAGQATLPDLLQHHGILVRPGSAVHHEYDHVHVADGGAGRPVHITVNRFFGVLVQAGGVDKDNLVIRFGLDPQHPVPRGLGLAGGDTDLLAQQVIQQGGLAHIGPADDGDITAAAAVSSHVRPASSAHPGRRPARPCADFYRSPLPPAAAWRGDRPH